ncbi:MAG: TrmH family RNA methyltransferase [Anaerolineae bacterium]|nr:RNA methyltransferase [Chloroflexota bacterium]
MLITSRQNARVKALRQLRMPKYRAREGRYLIEGVRVVEQALERGAPVETLVYAPELLVSERGLALVEAQTGLERVALSPDVFRSLSDRDTPQGLSAVVRMSTSTLEDLTPGPDALLVVAWQLQTPGNLGSIIRTSDAIGADAVIVVEPSADLYDPQTIRATMGSFYALPTIRVPEEGLLCQWLARLKRSAVPLRVMGTSAHAPSLLWEADCRGPLAVLLGNEQEGLNAQARQVADVLVRLPMTGSATSLNVSAAAAAILFEVVRQRTAASV